METPQEMRIFAERLAQFMNLWTVYSDLLTGRYIPSLNDEEWPVAETVMFMLYGYFYSLIEDSDDGLNGFRIWREKFADEGTAIGTVEAQVAPFLDRLRIFRNRLGFHGSRTRRHESPGFDLFTQHSGAEVWNAMRNFKALAAALFAKDMAQHGIGDYCRDDTRKRIDTIAARARNDLRAARADSPGGI